MHLISWQFVWCAGAFVTIYSIMVSVINQCVWCLHVPLLLTLPHPTSLQVGPTGTGKTVYIKNHLSQGLDRKAWAHMAFNFSAQTSANMTQVGSRAGGSAVPQWQERVLGSYPFRTRML